MPESFDFPKSSGSSRNADSESTIYRPLRWMLLPGFLDSTCRWNSDYSWGCKRFGPPNQGKKRTLVLDTDEYRYRTFISDISGQDIRAHGGDPQRAMREVRDWLRLASKRTTLPGSAQIIRHYRTFQGNLPEICSVFALEPDRLTFLDLSKIITDWLRKDR